MRRLSLSFFLILVLVLAACSSTAPSTSTQPAADPTTLPPTLPATTPTQASAASPVQQASAQVFQLAELTDSQGAVTVVVKPLELNSSQDTLSFEVTLDTHSIDLSMDLAPTDLAATVESLGQRSHIHLTWTDNATDEIVFNVYRRTPGKPWGFIGHTMSNVTSYTDVNTLTGNTYEYTVRAMHMVGNSAQSNIIRVTP